MDGPGKIFSPVWNQNKDMDILYVCIGPAFSADQLLEIHRIPNASRGRQHAQCLTDGFNNAFPSTNPEGTILVLSFHHQLHNFSNSGYSISSM